MAGSEEAATGWVAVDVAVNSAAARVADTLGTVVAVMASAVATEEVSVGAAMERTRTDYRRRHSE